jgi:small-conductance mechanosensitive channel
VVFGGLFIVFLLQGFVHVVRIAQRKSSDDMRNRRDHRDPSKITSLQTIIMIVNVLVIISTVAIATRKAGLSTQSSIGIAAIFTIILALATQSLAQEIVANVVFLFERRASVGDAVIIYARDMKDTVQGVVASVGIATIAIRRIDKSIAHIPFSSIVCVINESENDQIAIVEVPVDASFSPSKAVTEAKRICDVLRDDDTVSPYLRGAPYVQGVVSPMPHFFNIVIFAPCRERNKIAVGNYVRFVFLSEFERLEIPHPAVLSAMEPKK